MIQVGLKAVSTFYIVKILKLVDWPPALKTKKKKQEFLRYAKLTGIQYLQISTTRNIKVLQARGKQCQMEMQIHPKSNRNGNFIKERIWAALII